VKEIWHQSHIKSYIKSHIKSQTSLQHLIWHYLIIHTNKMINTHNDVNYDSDTQHYWTKTKYQAIIVFTISEDSQEVISTLINEEISNIYLYLSFYTSFHWHSYLCICLVVKKSEEINSRVCISDWISVKMTCILIKIINWNINNIHQKIIIILFTHLQQISDLTETANDQKLY